MNKLLRSVLTLAAVLVLSLGAASCGGAYTGYQVKVLVDQTPGFRYPDDYDKVRVQVDMDDGNTYGQTFLVSDVGQQKGAATYSYTFLVVEGDKSFHKAKALRVELVKGDIPFRVQVRSDVMIRDGELAQQAFTFSASGT